jgi:hypothetical protein
MVNTMPSEQIRIFDESFPPVAQKQLLQGLINAYRTAEAECKNLMDTPEHAHDLYPYIRWKIVDQSLQRLAQRIPGVSAIIASNDNGCHHTKIVAGRISLTISAVDTPKEVVRRAKYRADYAQDGQLSLDLGMGVKKDTENSADDLIYCILLHGPSQATIPGFAHIVFPNRDCTAYAEEPKNLYKEFSEVLTVNRIPEEIIAEPKPGLKRRIPTITQSAEDGTLFYPSQEEISESLPLTVKKKSSPQKKIG